jgi:hypothetical protein
MSNQQHLINLIKSLSGQANILAIPRVYISLCDGDLAAALLLSQIVYWSDKSSRKDGGFWKTFDEWEKEIGLSRYQIKRASAVLTRMGFLETKVKRANSAPTMHYFFNVETFTSSIIKFLEIRESATSEMQETFTSEMQETCRSLTETTAETTAEIEEEAEPARPIPPPPSLRPERMNDRQEALALWTAATGMLAYGGYNQEEIPAKLIAILKQERSFDGAAALCKRAYQAMLAKRKSDGREYSKLSHVWLDWALAHEIPGEKPEGKKVVKLD